MIFTTSPLIYLLFLSLFLWVPLRVSYRRAIAHSAQAFVFDGKRVFAHVPDVHEQCAVYDKVLVPP